jgi:hypothetical protein
LLAEHELTRLITLVETIADQVGVPAEKRPDVTPLEQDVPPEKVLEQLESAEEGARDEGPITGS